MGYDPTTDGVDYLNATACLLYYIYGSLSNLYYHGYLLIIVKKVRVSMSCAYLHHMPGRNSPFLVAVVHHTKMRKMCTKRS